MYKKTNQVLDKNVLENKGKRKVGRPKIIIDKNKLINLCKDHCTVDECCSFFGVCEETLNNFCKETFFSEDGTPLNFSEVYNRYKLTGNVSLRRLQWESAEKGNVDMQKWLGKNNLLQSDNAAELARASEQENRINALIDALMEVK